MAGFFAALVAAIGVFLFSSNAIAVKPRQIFFSSKTYGPDGPWQAVTVQLGTPTQQIDLFPGGSWVSNILNTSVCNNTQMTLVCYANAAGLFNSTASSTFSIQPETGSPKNGSADGFRVSLAEYGQNVWAFDSLDLGYTQEQEQVTIPDFDLLFQIEAYSILPDGSIYTMEVGNLALGAQDPNQTWPRGDGQTNFNGTFLPNWLYQINQTASSSYGLHIGSAPLGIPGSLWCGGYDQTRVLGPVSQQPYGSTWLPIDLLDIGIGVAEGQSPFDFTSKSGLLAEGNDTIGVKQEVWLDPTIPYLYLPQSTCDAITANLPVEYNPKLGLYVWQTTDPQYARIISAPSILEFTFRLNSSLTQNITINVPFSLLNLTLTAPLVDTPTQYFPCRPSNTSVYYLGRSFLQAAFIGVNWMEQTQHNGVWWLAQAPGPNTPSIPVEVDIGRDDRYIIASSNIWLDSWRGVWTPIGENGTSGHQTSSSGSGSGLSAATRAGIGIGVGIAVIGISLLLFFYFRRRRAARQSTRSGNHLSSTSGEEWLNEREREKNIAGYGPQEMEGKETREAVELGLPHKALMERRAMFRYEIGGRERPAELSG